MSAKSIIAGVIILLMIGGGFIALQAQNSNQEINLTELVSAINNGDVSKIEKRDSDIVITFTNDETRTLKTTENDDAFLVSLRHHGAGEEQLHAINFRYVGSSNLSFFPIIPFVIGFIYYGFVIAVLYMLGNRVKDNTSRTLWAAILLMVPIVGLIAYVFSTRPINMPPTQFGSVN